MTSKISFTLPSGQKMPAFGLGTWQATDDSEIERALNTALELGYRHIDTAHAYGNEKVIGKVLKQWFSSGKLKREDLFITTKLPQMGIHQDRVEMYMKDSLKNLQLDYVDLYLIHFTVGSKYKEGVAGFYTDENGNAVLEPKNDHIAIWRKMEEQVEAGRAKNIGLSNFNISQISNILKSAKIKPANLQVELHVFLQQRDLVEFCHKNGITIVAYSPLGNPSYNQFLQVMGQEPREVKSVLTDPVVGKIARKHSKSPAQIALRFLIQMGVAVIPKSVSPKRIEENMNIFDFKLDEGDMKELHNLDIGEAARVVDWKVVKGIENHPDYPFKK